MLYTFFSIQQTCSPICNTNDVVKIVSTTNTQPSLISSITQKSPSRHQTHLHISFISISSSKMSDQHPQRRYISLSYAEALASKHKAIGTLHDSLQTYAHGSEFSSTHDTSTKKPVCFPWNFPEVKQKKSPIDETQLPTHGGVHLTAASHSVVVDGD